MRQLLISSLIVIAVVSTASASDRYPVKKRYVNQTGEIVTIGKATQVAAIAVAPLRRALPPVQIVPVAKAPSTTNPALRNFAINTRSSSRDSLFGPINTDPADWPSGRKCCRPGEPYFNEEPNS